MQNRIANRQLAEASKVKDFMTKREANLKSKLIRLLQNDGKGHKYPKYAERLKKFNINIVALYDKSVETAAISFDEGIIYINEGFINDATTFAQLSVIIRHELCHNLLLHQYRMLRHIVAIPGSHVKLSSSLHRLLNIIEDFEISNKRYTDYDKEVVRHTWLNGKLISGLVTEDHRSDWVNLSVEEMYDAITEELETAETRLRFGDVKGTPTILSAVAGLYNYKQGIAERSDYETIDDLVNTILAAARKEDPDVKLPEEWQHIIDDLKTIETDPNNGYTWDQIVDMIKTIADSSAIKPCSVVSPVTNNEITKVYTPEEKCIAIEVLKIIGKYTAYPVDYERWYNEVMRVAKEENLSKDEIEELLKSLA